MATAQPAATLAGRWDAIVIVNGVEVPFPFEIVGEGAALKGSFFNGDRRITSTSVATEDGRSLVPIRAVRLDPADDHRPGHPDGGVPAGARRAIAVPRCPGVGHGRAALRKRTIHRRHVGGAGEEQQG